MATWTYTETDQNAKPRRSVTAVQTNAEATPPAAIDGMSLEAVAGFTVYMMCAVGQTFNAGTAGFNAWRYDSITGLVCRAPEHDIVVGTDAVGVRGVAVSFSVASPRGRICHIWDGTGVTSGNVTVTYTASMLVGVKA